MTRTEWTAFHHAIRADARAFQSKHGGYPCFRRTFDHKGVEWVFTRYQDYGPTWRGYMRPSIIRQRAAAHLIHTELDFAAEYRAKARRSPHLAYTAKRGARLSVKCAREWRLERDSGWLAAQAAA